MSRNRGGPGTSLWAPATALAAVAGAALFADHHTPADWRQILAWACAAVAALALVWAATLLRLMRAERAGREAVRRTADARAAEVAHLASVRLPAIAERLRSGRRPDSVPGALAPSADVGDEFARDLAAIAEALGSDEAVRRERVLRDSVQAAFESVARNMHAMATVQQQVLDRVERAIEDPRLMAEVMKADHAAAQMTRKAQTLLVMCGIWPARRETQPVSLYDCVRGAQSRIVEFNRIEVHGGQTLYVVPPAVEGLMHAIAELLENATVFSPSRTQVMVTVREVGAGAVVEIDDAGLGMPPDVLRQSTARLRDELDLAELGAVPRLGLACVGRWTRELGFGVELTGASAYGGTRAVTFVPYRLLTEPLSHFPGRRPVKGERAPEGYGTDPDGYREGRGAYAETAPVTAGRRGADAYDGPGTDAYDRARHTGPEASETYGRARLADHQTGPGNGEQQQNGNGGYRGAVPSPAAYPDAPQHSAAYQEPARCAGYWGAASPASYEPGGAAPHPTAPTADGQDGTPRTPGPTGTHGALPRRRSRRGAALEAAAQMALQPPPPAAPDLPADRSVWTPEAARASVASVVSGTRRGRAAVADSPGAEPAPATHPIAPEAHSGGRS
ncbi:ATP-binding protein [Streptomyces jumonjinensis]|uniref:ATP-binding protein n=1 Tax=Streptomyces jumonjinensis TaxID=1945 RepID=UPI00378DD25E